MSENRTITKNPYFGIGMEKLDRDAFSPEKIYDSVAKTGVKWVRIQSGWEKCEKVKGRYDFKWLDDIVEEIIVRNMEPWLCLSYGNPLYVKEAVGRLGSVGCQPKTEDAYTAWEAYCSATAKRYKGRITLFEVWNEPEWLWLDKGNAKEYALLCKRTALAVKKGNENAKIVIGATSDRFLEFACALKNCGAEKEADFFSYHSYTYDERIFPETAHALHALFGLPVIHGECGSQSKNGGNGAFKGIRVSEKMQAKQLLRQMVADRISDVYFSSYFSAIDMPEDLSAKAGKKIKKKGYFGIIRGDFEKNRHTLKPSFRALQNLCSLLSEETEKTYFPYFPIQEREKYPLQNFFRCGRMVGNKWHDKRLTEMVFACFQKRGQRILIYWRSTDMLARKNCHNRIRLQVADTTEKPALFDLLTGEKKPLAYKKREGMYYFPSLPVKDYPLAVLFGDSM